LNEIQYRDSASHQSFFLPRSGLVRIAEEGRKDQEVIVHHLAARLPKLSSVWSWHEEFVAEWSETSLTKKGKESRKVRRKGEKNG